MEIKRKSKEDFFRKEAGTSKIKGRQNGAKGEKK